MILTDIFFDESMHDYILSFFSITSMFNLLGVCKILKKVIEKKSDIMSVKTKIGKHAKNNPIRKGMAMFSALFLHGSPKIAHQYYLDNSKNINIKHPKFLRILTLRHPSTWSKYFSKYLNHMMSKLPQKYWNKNSELCYFLCNCAKLSDPHKNEIFMTMIPDNTFGNTFPQIFFMDTSDLFAEYDKDFTNNSTYMAKLFVEFGINVYFNKYKTIPNHLTFYRQLYNKIIHKYPEMKNQIDIECNDRYINAIDCVKLLGLDYLLETWAIYPFYSLEGVKSKHWMVQTCELKLNYLESTNNTHNASFLIENLFGDIDNKKCLMYEQILKYPKICKYISNNLLEKIIHKNICRISDEDSHIVGAIRNYIKNIGQTRFIPFSATIHLVKHKFIIKKFIKCVNFNCQYQSHFTGDLARYLTGNVGCDACPCCVISLVFENWPEWIQYAKKDSAHFTTIIKIIVDRLKKIIECKICDCHSIDVLLCFIDKITKCLSINNNRKIIECVNTLNTFNNTKKNIAAL